MASLAKSTRTTIIPAMHYRNAAAAIDWLCNVFGFEKQTVYAGEDGTIGHAQLTFGNGMIMCGSKRDSEYGRLLKQPDEIGGCETQSLYLVVTDADAIHKRVVESGAEIVIDIRTQDYGGRDFTCRDLEGHIWTFGTYDPWATQT